MSHKTAKVTETNGYILDTEITYDMDLNAIVIKPTDPYEEGVFYILTISDKVRSVGGNHLKRDVYIIFKIKDKRIDEYRVLPQNTIVAKPRRKPERLKAETAARAYGFTPKQKEKIGAAAKKGTLPYDRLKVNMLIAVLSIPLAVAGLAGRFTPVVLAGAVLMLAGVMHIAVQLRDKRKRSALQYNVGVMFFNAGFYKPAKKRFAKAAGLDPYNEMAELAVNKAVFYK